MNGVHAIAVLLMLPASLPAAPGVPGPAPLPGGPTAVEALSAKVPRPHHDAWYVSEVHRRYRGHIVFSRLIVDPPGEVEARFSRAFSRRDPLYGRVYLERSLANTPVAAPGLRPIFPPESGYFVRMFVDGKPFDGEAGVLFAALRLSSSLDEDRQLTTWRFDLRPAEGDVEPTELSLAWTRAINRLAPGKRRIRLEVWGGDLQQHTRTPRAVGELVLTVGRDDFASSGRRAPQDGYHAPDKETLRAAVRPLFARASPALEPERVRILKVWSQRLEPGSRHALVAGREADRDGDRICEWRVLQVRQDGSPGAWRGTRLEECVSPECVPLVADCE